MPFLTRYFIGLLILFFCCSSVLAQEEDLNINQSTPEEQALINQLFGETEEVDENIDEPVIIDGGINNELDVREQKVLPDSPFYFIKDWWRGIKLALTFNQVSKEELRLRQMNERIVEVMTLFDQPVDPQSKEAINKTVNTYKEQSEKFKSRATEMKGQMENSEQYQKMLEKGAEWGVKAYSMIDEVETDQAVSESAKGEAKEVLKVSANRIGAILTLIDDSGTTSAIFEKFVNDDKKRTRDENFAILNKIKAQVSDQVKGVIQQAQTKVRESLRQQLQKVDIITEDNLMNEFMS